MAQTWRQGTWESQTWAESVWEGVDNGVEVAESVQSSFIPSLNGWYWFW